MEVGGASSDQAHTRGSGDVANTRVMVYLQPDLLRAMKLQAVERGGSVSEVFADAAREYLAARGRAVPSNIATRPGTRSATNLDAIENAIVRQSAVMDAIMLRLEGLGAARTISSQAGGTKPAQAMKVILHALGAAGPNGLTPGDLADAMTAARIRSGTAETAKAQLREAGVIRFETRRWYLARGT